MTRAPSAALLELCERQRDALLGAWDAALRDLPDFQETPPSETRETVERLLGAFVSRLRGDGDDDLDELARELAGSRFRSGLPITAPIAAAGRFRGAVFEAMAPEQGGRFPWGLVDDQIDAFNGRLIAAHAELMVQVAESRLGELFENASDVLLRFDAEGHIVDVNRSFQRVLGRERSAWIGRSWVDLVSPADREAARETLQAIAEGTAVTARPLLFVRADGQPVRLILSGHRSGSDDRPTMVAVLRDVTGEEALRAHVIQAEKLASIGQLAASVAHELNNPLTWVSVNLAEVIDGLGTTDGEVRQMLDDACLGVERMATIVSDLRTYARTGEEATEFPLGDVLDLALRIAGTQLSHRVRVERDYGALPTFVGHAGRLSQVFVNLFVNAAQAMSARSISENLLSIRASFEQGQFDVEIRDNGPGISGEVASHVFEPFVSTKGGGGTGLGLWVCKNIVEEHGGTIHLSSGTEGTVFRIRLPRREPTADRAVTSSPRANPATGRILVIDDEEMLLRVLDRRLSGRHDVVTASGGEEALRIITADPDGFDAVICDLGMPDMNGMELYEAVLARFPRLGGRFRFMSGAPQWAEDRALGELGVRCFRKPLEIDALTEEVDAIVARRRGEEP